MGLSYQPKAITLSFKEGKPVTYKAQQVTYPTIKSKDLLAYAANAANVPLANIECCVQGLIEAIAYFCINGHRVVLPKVKGIRNSSLNCEAQRGILHLPAHALGGGSNFKTITTSFQGA